MITRNGDEITFWAGNVTSDYNISTNTALSVDNLGSSENSVVSESWRKIHTAGNCDIFEKDDKNQSFDRYNHQNLVKLQGDSGSRDRLVDQGDRFSKLND